MEELQAEIDILKADEARLDFEIQLEETKKRLASKRRSQHTIVKVGKEVVSVAGKVGKGFVSAADAVFGGSPPTPKTSPPPKANKKLRRKKKKKASKTPKHKKEKDEDYFIPFF